MADLFFSDVVAGLEVCFSQHNGVFVQGVDAFTKVSVLRENGKGFCEVAVIRKGNIVRDLPVEHDSFGIITLDCVSDDAPQQVADVVVKLVKHFLKES